MDMQEARVIALEAVAGFVWANADHGTGDLWERLRHLTNLSDPDAPALTDAERAQFAKALNQIGRTLNMQASRLRSARRERGKANKRLRR